MAAGGGWKFTLPTGDGTHQRRGHAADQEQGVPLNTLGAGDAVNAELLHNQRYTDGNRPIAMPWLLWLLLAALLGLLIGLTVPGLVKDDRIIHKTEEIIELIHGLNTTVQCPDVVNNFTVVLNETCDNASQIIYCDYFIGGAGPGGIYTAYRLAPHGTVCIVDLRDRIGGKVFTYESPENETLKTPTCAEQLRASDYIGRCWYQELGVSSYGRSAVCTYFEGFDRGRNWTAPVCNTDVPPEDAPDPPACLEGLAYGRVHPNGDGSPLNMTYYGLPDACDGTYGDSGDWRDCSYETVAYGILFSSPPPSNDVTFLQWCVDTLGFQEWCDMIIASSGASDIFLEPHSARWVYDYFNFDAGLGYSAIYVPDEGPYYALVLALGHILGNGSSLYLGEKLLAIDDVAAEDAVYTFQLTTSKHVFRSKRVVGAIPPYFVKDLKGDMGGQLAGSKFTAYGDSTRACTWNAFFESKWWQPQRSQCHIGYYVFAKNTFEVPEEHRDGVQWTFVESGSTSLIKTIQYIPTPGRYDSNLLRFFWDGHDCEKFQAIVDQSGQEGLREVIEAALHARFDVENETTVSGIVDSFFMSEDSGYSGIRVGADFDLFEQADWAKEPFAGRKLCLVSEGYNTKHSGWQEGAWESAHACFRQQYLDIFTEEEIASWETCCNPNGEEADNNDFGSYENAFYSSSSSSSSSSGSASSSSTGGEFTFPPINTNEPPNLPECISPDDITWGPCINLDGEMPLKDYWGLCYCGFFDNNCLTSQGLDDDHPPQRHTKMGRLIVD